MDFDRVRKSAVALWKSERGTTGILFGIMALPLVVMIGAAVDMARVVRTRDILQSAMDASMLAAGKVAAADQPAVAAAFFNANARAIRDAVATFTVGADGNIVGEAKTIVKTPFTALVNTREIAVNIVVKVRPAKTTLVANERLPCMHVMDQSGARTFWLDNNDQVDASTCDVRVRSGSSEGVYENSSSNVKFGMVRVKGASAITSGYTAETFSIVNAPHEVKDGEPIVSDPYNRFVDDVRSSIRAGNCNGSNTGRTLSGRISPGTYCGATEFRDATLQAGLYIISSSGSKDGTLKFSGVIDGSAGVSFYFADSKSMLLSYGAEEGSVLAAPQTGLTQGLLFFDNSNRGGVYSVNISSCKTHSWTGLIYMPGTNFTFQNLEAWPKFNVSVSSNQIYIKGWRSMTLDAFSWTPNGQSTPVVWPGEPVTTTSEAAVIE